jgi:hypothetical protein
MLDALVTSTSFLEGKLADKPNPEPRWVSQQDQLLKLDDPAVAPAAPAAPVVPVADVADEVAAPVGVEAVAPEAPKAAAAEGAAPGGEAAVTAAKAAVTAAEAAVDTTAAAAMAAAEAVADEAAARDTAATTAAIKAKVEAHTASVQAAQDATITYLTAAAELRHAVTMHDLAGKTTEEQARAARITDREAHYKAIEKEAEPDAQQLVTVRMPEKEAVPPPELELEEVLVDLVEIKEITSEVFEERRAEEEAWMPA